MLLCRRDGGRNSRSCHGSLRSLDPGGTSSSAADAAVVAASSPSSAPPVAGVPQATGIGTRMVHITIIWQDQLGGALDLLVEAGHVSASESVL